MADHILDVDLLAFERGDAQQRRAVVDGVRRSLATGFVFTATDVPEADIDEAYDGLARFFALPPEEKDRFVEPGSHGQTGYTGLLVETAATADLADWKEMLSWGRDLPLEHPLRRRFPHRYAEQVLPEAAVPGITAMLLRLHDSLAEVLRRFLRVIAVGLGAHESFFEEMLRDGAHLSRAIRYPPMVDAPPGHVWSAEHADINLVTALPRATTRGLEVRTAAGWVEAVAPEGHMVVNTGMMLKHVSNGLLLPASTASSVTPRRRRSGCRWCTSATPRRGPSSPR